MNLTDDAAVVLANPDIDIVVELIGGLEPARTFILQAIANGKHVVTANKALLARHGNEIFAAAHAKGVMVAFEGAVAGGIPIIKALREGLTANRIEWIAGIINGTSNFILSEMRATGASFDAVLSEAQARGYAEADPTFDIEGIDAAHKLTIMSAIAFGVPMQFDKVYTEGISKLTREDIRYAEELGYRIKLLGITRRTAAGIELRVHPTLIPATRLIANVEGVMNAVLVKGDAVGATMYYGAGAGAEPTASAVIADLVDVTRMHTADPEHRVPHLAFQPDQLSDLPFLPMGDVETSYYLRMRVQDRPGVLADITRILADREISIDAMIQKEPSEGEEQTDIILLTHRTVEKNVVDAIAKIEALPTVTRQGRAHPPGRAQLMRYVSTRGAWADDPQPFCAILLEGLAPDGGLAVPQTYPRSLRGPRRAAPMRATAISPSRSCRASSTTSRPHDLKALIDRTYTQRRVRQRRHHAAHRPRAGSAPAARVERSDARVQGHRAAASGQPVRVRARASNGRDAQHPRRDVGRHREAPPSTRCAASAASRVFMLSPKGRMSPFQTAQMFSLADPNIHNLADRGHVRRMPGHRQGGQRRRGVQGALRDRHRQLDQLGARRRAGRLLLQGLFRGDAARRRAGRFRRAIGQLRQHPGGARRAQMGLPIRRLILATNENDVLDEFFRTGRYRPRVVGRDARDVEPVDGHLEGVQLRALRVRHGRPRSRGAARAVGADRAMREASISPARRTGRASPIRASCPARARTPIGSRPFARSLPAIGVIVDPHTADGVHVGRRYREAGVPLVCIETALPAKFAATIHEALGREPDRPSAYTDLEARPQHSTEVPADADACQGVHCRAR